MRMARCAPSARWSFVCASLVLGGLGGCYCSAVSVPARGLSAVSARGLSVVSLARLPLSALESRETRFDCAETTAWVGVWRWKEATMGDGASLPTRGAPRAFARTARGVRKRGRRRPTHRRAAEARRQARSSATASALRPARLWCCRRARALTSSHTTTRAANPRRFC
mmetsp:Transcript_33534/g.117551  ORF Transcript_33534/g.117551 Transcript_33534/m.117551 type:complete len:168 (+) Transcript_33534:84-587(+)